MPYDFPPAEQAQVSAYYVAGPASNQPGNYQSMYDYIAQRLEMPAQTDPALASARAPYRSGTIAGLKCV